MEEEYELSEYANVHDLRKKDTQHTHTEQPGKRLLLYGILTLGFLCIIQATLNVALRLAYNSKEDTDADQFPVNILSKCQKGQNSTKLCSCYISKLRKLSRKYKALQRENDYLQDQLRKLMEDKRVQDYGSGDLEGYQWDTD